MVAIKKKTKRKPKQTLAEFRAWLSGVEELQTDDWFPTMEQWSLIRGRIDKIIEPEPIVEHLLPSGSVSTQPFIPHADAPAIGIPPPPPASGGVPGGNIEPNQNISSISTPNIDTTDGQYESGFV